MHGIFTNIYPINEPNVGKYIIHGASGLLFTDEPSLPFKPPFIKDFPASHVWFPEGTWQNPSKRRYHSWQGRIKWDYRSKPWYVPPPSDQNGWQMDSELKKIWENCRVWAKTPIVGRQGGKIRVVVKSFSAKLIIIFHKIGSGNVRILTFHATPSACWAIQTFEVPRYQVLGSPVVIPLLI